MQYQKLVVVVLFLCVIIAKSELFFKCTKLYCNSKSKHVANYSCTLKPVNRYKALANIIVNIKRPLKNININTVLYVRNTANVYQPFIINVTFNFCRLIATGKGDFFSMAIQNVLYTNSNINHSCPYVGSIRLKDFYFDRKMMPMPTIPKRSFKAVLKFYEGVDYVGVFAYYIDVVDSRD